MSSWQPEQQGLRQLLFLLRDAANTKSRDHCLINQRLSVFNEHPDYYAYLVHILVYLKKEDTNTRLVAGIQLKNNIKNQFNTIHLLTLDYIKEACISALLEPDSDPLIHKSISSVISAIVRRGQVHNWIDVILLLIKNIDDVSQPHVSKISLDTLVMICEDAAPELDGEIQGIRPLRFMLPKFIQLFSNPDPQLRVQAITATSQFVLLKPESFIAQLDNILTALYTLTGDKDPRVRRELSRIFTILLEAFPEKLEPYLYPTIDFMIHATQDEDAEIALAACDFWEQYAHINRYKDQLKSYLPRLIPCLLDLMVYSEKDLLDIEDKASSPERSIHDDNSQQILATTDISQTYYPSKNHSSQPPPPPSSVTTTATSTDTNNPPTTPTPDTTTPHTAAVVTAAAAAAVVNKSDNGDDLSDVDQEESDFDDDDTSSCSDMNDNDDDFEDDEFYSEHSLRKSSATALEILTVTFGDDVATILLDRLLNHTLQDKNWIVRESGILALGAAALGGINVICKDLVKLVPFLLQSMQDPQPLVRSISCWVVSRFSNWLAYNEEHKNFFEPVLFGLLHRLLDSNKRVQKFACTAFITLTECASIKLVPYIYPILTHTNRAFTLYKKNNRPILYDAVRTLADAVGKELNQPQYIYLLMPPLIAIWNELSDKDTALFPLLECLSNITAALGPGFIQYVDPVLTRCVKLISSTLTDQILADHHPEEMMPPNVEFLISPLDLLSGIVQGLGPKIDPLIAQTNPPLLALLGRCIHDPVPEVLQSTFVLIGDIARASFPLLVPYLHAIFREMISILHNREYIIPISVYNNVLWALGEIVIRWEPNQVRPYIPSLMEVLLPLLTHPMVPTSIHENTMIVLGRLGLSNPSYIAPYLRSFLLSWLEKSRSVREDEEKDTAFRGLCAIIKFNARDAHDALFPLLAAFSRYQKPSDVLLVEMTDVVKGYCSITHADQWKEIMDRLDPEAQTYISNLLSS